MNIRRDLGRISLGLSGGAAKGLAHIGVLKALEEFEIIPDVIAGTSAGALIGGLYARGISVNEMCELVKTVNVKKMAQLIDLSFKRGFLIDGKNIETFLSDIIGDVLIEDLPITFIATAVDINTGKGIYIKTGKLIDAIRASISIPAVFKPVQANGTLYVDGGVRQNLPLSVLRDYKPDVLIGVNVLKNYHMVSDWESGGILRDGDPNYKKRDDLWRSIKEIFEKDSKESDKMKLKASLVLSRTFSIIMSELSEREIQSVAPDLVIPLDMRDIQLWDFWKGEMAVDLGYRQSLPLIEKFLNSKE